MKAPARRGNHRRRRAALSSVYGFIMIYLLVIASLQAISTVISSGEAAATAAQQAAEVAQMRSLERLQVASSGDGNVTVTNDGMIPSLLSFVLLQNSSASKAVPVQESLAVGASVVVHVGTPLSQPSVAVVTSLGDVFESGPSSQGLLPPGVTGRSLNASIGGPGVDAQLYQNPDDPGRFFLAEGQSVSAYSSSTGSRLWSFDAGQGEVTDVMPLSDGGVYAADGYYGDQFTSELFRLSSSGTSLDTYSMRLFRLYTAVEVQFANGAQSPYPLGSQPVQKGLDGLYAYYDGWFFSSSGPSTTTVPADQYNLASADTGDFYLYDTGADPGGFGCTYPKGNGVTIYGYEADSQGVTSEWSTTMYMDRCDLYPNELVASTAGSGVVASLFSQVYWSQPNYYAGPYQGANPFLSVLSSSSGTVLRNGTLDSNGYTSVATDGAQVFLAIPSSDQIEVLSSSGRGGGTFYDVGFPASTLQWDDGSLFAISASQVDVYSPSMNLVKAIHFSPYSFYSLASSKPLEPQMIQPSFLVLNSTTYVALLRNSTGYGDLVVGAYSP